MEQVYNTDWKNNCNTAVALGYFDGVHIAHKYLIGKMSDYAVNNNLSKAIFTFTKTIKLGHKGKDLLSINEKVNEISKLGVDLFYCPNFFDFANLTPEEFVDDILVDSMGAKAIFCGENFMFGKNRTGNVKVLKELCSERGIHFEVVDTVIQNGEIVSSTLVRNSLIEGDIKKVNSLLGRTYSIKFPVVHGKKLGRTLGVPTINQVFEDNMCMPKIGVYMTATRIDNVIYPSATGISTRPTVEGEGVSCETHIDGFTGDLYGKKVEVDFYDFLHQAKKYDNLQELANMIEEAVEMSKKHLDILRKA